jgi:dipeptidyl aminopeptidase/acylaminoacyl peptidase
MAGVDHAIASYDIDEARMGVTGYSYGGYLTNWIITQTDRFAAAVAGASISNWVSDYGVADIPRTKESEFYGPPWEERGLENLLRSSPIIHAKGVTTPTMFVHGEADLRVPIEEAEQMYVALRKQRVPAKFVRYPESYHGGWTPWRMVHRYWIQLEWWEQWLAERATSQ